MGPFDALAMDDSDDDELEEQEEVGAANVKATAAENSLSAVSMAAETDEDGWQLVKGTAKQTSDEDESESDDRPSCFICSRPVTARFRGVSIPCSIRCNPQTKVHKRCLVQWRDKSESCPLCRAALVPDKQPLLDGGAREAEDDIGTYVFVELDAKARRGSAAARSGKALTFKAAQQRHYAMAKRDLQRAQAKMVTFAEHDDDDY